MSRGLFVAFLAVACLAPAPQDPSGVQRRGTFMGGHMGFMTTGGVSTTVDVFDPVSGGTIGGVGVSTAGQESIIAVPSLNRMYVTHDTGAVGVPGRVSVIDTTTMTELRNFPIPNGEQLRRMSLSPDQRTLFISGQNVGIVPNQAGVFALDLTTNPEGISYVGGITSASHAEGVECVPVSSADLRPAKVYFTDSGSGMLTSIGLIPPTGVGTPVNPPPGLIDLKVMDVSPDFSRLIIGGICNMVDEVRVAVVDTTVDPPNPVVAIVDNTLTGLNNEVMDIVFRPEMAPLSAYFVALNPATGNTFVYHVDDVGGRITGPTSPGPPPNVESIAHLADPLAPVGFRDMLYLGDDPLAGLPYRRMDASPVPPLPPVPILPDASANSATPIRFAFMPIGAGPPPPPRIDRICPKGLPNGGGDTVRIEGADFQVGAVVSIDGFALTTNFIDSNTLTATTINFPQMLMLDVQVQNPDAQTDLLDMHYANFAPPGTPQTFNLTLPDVSTGYQMFSLPLYASITDLRTALETALGPYNPNNYRVFLRIRDQYVELPNVPADECDLMGVSFWVLTRFGGSISVTAPNVFENPGAARIRVVPLFPGWNMVSTPFMDPAGPLIDYDWTTVQVAALGSDVSGTGTIPTGAAAALINPTLFGWTGTGYGSITTMQAGEGYFVSNRTAGMVYLVFDTLLVFKPTVPSAPSFAPLPAGTSTPPPPPGAALGEPSSGCGGLGLEGVLLVLAWRVFHRPRRRRRLAS